jgi:hypothetical protein
MNAETKRKRGLEIAQNPRPRQGVQPEQKEALAGAPRNVYKFKQNKDLFLSIRLAKSPPQRVK